MSDLPPTEARVIPFPSRLVPGLSNAPGLEGELREAISEGFAELDEDPIDQADRAAIDNEEVFLKRFRFDAPRVHRQQVIDLKHRVDLTDREIRFLATVGGFAFGENEARISAPLVLTLWGSLQLLCLWVLMAIGLAVASEIRSISLEQIAMLVGLEFALLGVGVGVHQLYIQPARIARRAARREAAPRPG